MVYGISIAFCILFNSIDNTYSALYNSCSTIRTSTIYDTQITTISEIKKHQYPIECHHVRSKDGYMCISELHRIPYGKSGPENKQRFPIILVHGLSDSSFNWVINGPQKSLAYRLADEEYDVWMANLRGNTYSRKHIEYKPWQKKFWNYSFHEMGIYDMPANVDYILKTTNQSQLIYVGHSLGTTVFFMTSSLPKMKFLIGLAPVGSIKHTTSPLRFLKPFSDEVNSEYDWYSRGILFENDSWINFFKKLFCTDSSTFIGICHEVIVYRFFGIDRKQFDPNLFQNFINSFPAGFSLKTFIHCVQLGEFGFQNYDYDLAGNLRIYHAATSPKYNLTNISVPVRFYYGDNDLLANPLDTKLLYQRFHRPLGLVRVDNDNFTHVDFFIAKDINKLVNDELVQFIKNATDPEHGLDFITNTIENATSIRANSPVPVDEPFNEKLFFKDVQRLILPKINTSNFSISKRTTDTLEARLLK